MDLVLRVAVLLLAFPVSYAAKNAQVTWFHTGGAPGACGQMHYDDEYIAALAYGTFDTYPGANKNDPNHNPTCNRRLKATFEGKSVVVMVADRCPGCHEAVDMDFSPAAFSVLADQSRGRLYGVDWDWTDLPLGPVTKARRRSEQHKKLKGSRRMDPHMQPEISSSSSGNVDAAETAGLGAGLDSGGARL